MTLKSAMSFEAILGCILLSERSTHNYFKSVQPNWTGNQFTNDTME